jgi:hypothetical protein
VEDYEHARAQALRSAGGNFEKAMHMMRRRDPQAAEDGFDLVREIAGEHVDELIEEFGREVELGTRRWLLELLGEVRSPRAFKVFAVELDSDDESLRDSAQRGLQLLDTKDARRLLRQRATETGKSGHYPMH